MLQHVTVQIFQTVFFLEKYVYILEVKNMEIRNKNYEIIKWNWEYFKIHAKNYGILKLSCKLTYLIWKIGHFDHEANIRAVTYLGPSHWVIYLDRWPI